MAAAFFAIIKILSLTLRNQGFGGGGRGGRTRIFKNLLAFRDVSGFGTLYTPQHSDLQA